MVPPRIIIIGETPSLAASLEELLRAEGLSVAVVPSLRAAELLALGAGEGPAPLFIAACNAARCESARAWEDGRFRGGLLIVVGGRDLGLRARPGVHLVSLPLIPREVLGLVHRLIGSEGSTAARGAAVSLGGPTEVRRELEFEGAGPRS